MDEKMSLLQDWRDMAYNQETDKNQLQKFWTDYFLIEKGIYANVYAAEVIRRLKSEHLEWLTESFTKKENCVSIYNFSALRACMETDQIKAAENLLERGMDFKRFLIWMKDSGYQAPDTAQKALEDHWKTLRLTRKSAENPKLDGQQLV